MQKIIVVVSISYLSFYADNLEGQEKSSHKTIIIDSLPKKETIDYLEVFQEDLKRYKPNAPWIVESFMDMNFKQFGIAFNSIMKILTVPQKRWFYFCSSSKDFDGENYWSECLWQCIYFERWMGTLSMDTSTLVYKDVNHKKINFIQILALIDQSNAATKLVNDYYQFYAFYTDCLSHFFCQAVYSCYESINDPNAYKVHLTSAKKSLNKMKQHLIILKKSKLFYATYKMTLDSYKNILALLEAEKINSYLNK